MPKAVPRRLASLLLRSAIRVTPPDTLDWAQAMLSELSHVEGDWTALLWAVGGASVLAKHALLSVVIPRSNGQTVPSGGDLFTKEGPMRKTTLAAAGACAVASLLFFLAPAFRQAFQVSLAQWNCVLHVTPLYMTLPHRESGLEALARRAEQEHDAEGVAFVAARLGDSPESARLADEAIRLDPKLTWVYAVVAVRNPLLSEIDRWVPKLKQWDPQNALSYLITAESIDIHPAVREKLGQRHRAEDESPAWQNALTAAFQSPKLDTYLDRLRELDRRVLIRYGLDDPYQVIEGEFWPGLPSYTVWDSSRYSKSLLESGEMLEERGDRKGALEKYWAVARFGQMIGSAGGFMACQTTQGAYKRLEALSIAEGNKQQAELYAYLAGKIEQAEKERSDSWLQRVTGGAVSRWNASVVRISGLMMLFSGGLALICVSRVIAKGGLLRPGTLRVSRVTVTLGIGSAAGLLLSTAMLYVSYRPYAEILRAYVRDGDQSRIEELTEFLAYTQLPLGVHDSNQLDFVFYFWSGVTALCVIGLLLAVLRYLQNRPQTSVAT
jgi:tetratricopeptide (TPR) repeat protein